MNNRYNKGFVYVLTNKSMKGMCKIGVSQDVNRRISELSQPTGVPQPFKLEFAYEVRNYQDVEKALHKAFEKNRVNPKKEFFKINPESIKPILELLAIDKKDITKEIEQKVIRNNASLIGRNIIEKERDRLRTRVNQSSRGRLLLNRKNPFSSPYR